MIEKIDNFRVIQFSPTININVTNSEELEVMLKRLTALIDAMVVPMTDKSVDKKEGSD